jgi:hypothetical protein
MSKEQLMEQENALNKEIEKELDDAGKFSDLKITEFESQMQLYDNEPLSGSANNSQPLPDNFPQD